MTHAKTLATVCAVLAALAAPGSAQAQACSTFGAGLSADTHCVDSDWNLFARTDGDGVVTPIPEPIAYTLMLASLAAIGVIARRREAD